MLLVAFLHTRHQVSYAACGLILTCLNLIFVGLSGALVQPMPVTLKTVFSRLGLKDDRFTQHIICYNCHRLFDRGIHFDTLCSDCGTELFRPATQHLFQSVVSAITGGTSSVPPRQPHLVAPIQLLSDGLRDLFERPGMIPAVNLWKVRPQVEGESKAIQDGEVWQTIKGVDGTRFFFGGSSELEIRLGVTFSLDWWAQHASFSAFVRLTKVCIGLAEKLAIMAPAIPLGSCLFVFRIS